MHFLFNAPRSLVWADFWILVLHIEFEQFKKFYAYFIQQNSRWCVLGMRGTLKATIWWGGQVNRLEDELSRKSWLQKPPNKRTGLEFGPFPPTGSTLDVIGLCCSPLCTTTLSILSSCTGVLGAPMTENRNFYQCYSNQLMFSMVRALSTTSFCSSIVKGRLAPGTQTFDGFRQEREQSVAHFSTPGCTLLATYSRCLSRLFLSDARFWWIFCGFCWYLVGYLTVFWFGLFDLFVCQGIWICVNFCGGWNVMF